MIKLYAVYKKTQLKYKDTDMLIFKNGKICMVKTIIMKKAGESALLSDKVDLRTRDAIGIEERGFVMMKGSNFKKV